MKTRYIAIFTALAAALSLASCNKEVSEDISIKEAAVKGELLVKFSPEVADILDNAGLTKAGIPSVDEILSLAGTYEFQRVFPVDPRTEERTRQSGLHLWYIVRFDDARDIEEVARELTALGEVQGVEYNHTIKRAYNAQKRAIPFDIARTPATKASTGLPFNDPALSLQWNLINDGTLWDRGFKAGADVNVSNAWNKSVGEESVIVAVVDEGIFYDHPDLAANMWHNEGEIFASPVDNDGNGYAGDYYGYNFVQNTGQVSYSLKADTGHASHVAGVIAAQNNNGIGISSIAGGNGSIPGVKLMSCQIFSGNYVASILAEVQAIKYAADNGAVILQCSWGYTSSKANAYDWSPQYGTDEEWMEQNIIEKDALFYFVHTAGDPNGPINGGIGVFASGNESAPAAGYPGAYGDFVSVIGTAPDYTPAVYTNYGWRSDICAPGGDQDYFYDYKSDDGYYGEIGCILSTVPYHISESGYAYFEGSSMATPHVSAALALAISYAAQNRKTLSADDYKRLLYQTATPLDSYMTGSKGYYKYVADLGQNQYKKMDLDSFKGQMGHGQLNVDALLNAVMEEGTPMVFPNVYLALDGQMSYYLKRYFANPYSATVVLEDSSLADFEIDKDVVTFYGRKEGVTNGRIICSGQEYPFTLTVRKGNANGWL